MDSSISLTPLLTTGAITGTVSKSGKPVTKTQVFVMDGSIVLLSTPTDSNGGFSFEAVPEKSYVLKVNSFQANKPVTVTKQTTVDGSIDVGATGTITGTVTQPGFGGKTIRLSGATVAVTGTSLQTTTNSDGNFTLNLVPVGVQTLTGSNGSCYSMETKTVTVIAQGTVDADLSLSQFLSCVGS